MVALLAAIAVVLLGLELSSERTSSSAARGPDDRLTRRPDRPREIERVILRDGTFAKAPDVAIAGVRVASPASLPVRSVRCRTGPEPFYYCRAQPVGATRPSEFPVLAVFASRDGDKVIAVPVGEEPPLDCERERSYCDGEITKAREAGAVAESQ